MNARNAGMAARRRIAFALGSIVMFAWAALTGPAAAQIQWRTGAALEPAPQRPAAVAQTIRALTDDETQHIILRFDAPVTRAERGRLASAGVDLLAPLGGYAFFARVHAPMFDVNEVGRIATLEGAQPIERSHKMHPMLWDDEVPVWAIVEEGFDIDGDPDPIVGAYIMFHRGVPLADGAALVQRHGGIVRSELPTINSLVIELPYSEIGSLADEDLVQWIEPPLPKFDELNNSNRDAVQATQAQQLPYNLDGTDVVVMVYDGGTALASHSDFGGRLSIRDGDGLSDHATHVAGTIGGNGAGSGGLYRGMAPNCTLLSYGFEWSGGIFLYENPGDMAADYGDAINDGGAVISNNSIGTNTETNGFDCAIQGNYGITSALIDSIVRGDLGAPIRIVWANGNERQGDRCDVEGFGDFYSTAPPAGAKNHLTVGAMNSNDNSVTSFTSWGPTDDGRLKPDISAPGCQSNDDDGVTSCSSGGGYTTKCGTSMASPTTAGCAALLLEDFRNQYPSRPDYLPSTNKVLFAHTALDLENTGPDYKTGYGLIQVTDAVDHLRTGQFLEDAVDQGGEQTYLLDVQDAGEVKVTLAWDDPPGTPNVDPALVNDLDLLVTGPGGTYYPWTLDPLDPDAPAVRNEANSRDNLEQVLIDNASPGTYMIRVAGFDVPEGPQTFSLAASPGLVHTQILLIDKPDLVAPGEPATITAWIGATGETLIADSPTLHYRFDEGAFDTVAMIPLGDGLYEANVPATTCDADVAFFLTAEGSISGEVALPAGAPAETFGYDVGEFITSFSDDFETDQGWTVTNNGLTDGPWQRAVPVDCNRGDPPADADGSGFCYVTDNELDDGCNNDVDGGTTTLTSPVMDASHPAAMLSYYRWYSNVVGSDPMNDIFVIDVSDDGGASWVNLEIVGPDGPEVNGGWFFREFIVAEIPGIENTDQLRLRFVASDLNDGSVIEAAVDGVEIRWFQCEDVIVPGDIDGNGVVNVQDLLAVLAAWGPCPGCPEDLNDDEVVNVADLLILLANWGP